MSTSAPFRPSGQRILLAEDDPTTRRIVSFKLGRDGYTVETADNGEQLLQMAAARPPALFILDLMMPIQDGFSTLLRLKEEPALAGIPVIVLSAKNDEEEVVRCLNAGAADYVVKPFSPEELAVRVGRLLKK
ncbi:MAG: response regulator transcription factor [Opitutaceae bacterium]|nr:response regulator transcription factor [Opitutaceae bacterium]